MMVQYRRLPSLSSPQGATRHDPFEWPIGRCPEPRAGSVVAGIGRLRARRVSRDHESKRTQPPPERIEPEAERLERHHAEQARVTAPAEDDGSGPAAIADLVAHVPHLAADASAVRQPEHLRLLWLRADPAEHTRGHHGVY